MKEKMKYPKDHWSASAFMRFEECPRKWWFEYVRYPQELKDVPAFVIGNAYHDAIASMYRGEPLESCIEIYTNKLGGVASYKDSESIKESIRYYYTNVYPFYRSKVASVESEKTIVIPGLGLPLMFRMDLETLDGVLVDHKTVGGRAPSVFNNAQLDIYSLAYLTEKGRLPRAVELHLAYKDKKRVEVKAVIPTLADVLCTLTRVRSFLGLVKKNSFPCKRTGACRTCPFKSECDSLVIASHGDDII